MEKKIIKNDEISTTLKKAWENAYTAIYMPSEYKGEEFNIEKFIELIKETHKYFLPYYNCDTLPKDMVEILLIIHKTNLNATFLDLETTACTLIAYSLLCEVKKLKHDELLKTGKINIKVYDKNVVFDIEEFNIDLIVDKMYYQEQEFAVDFLENMQQNDT